MRNERKVGTGDMDSGTGQPAALLPPSAWRLDGAPILGMARRERVSNLGRSNEIIASHAKRLSSGRPAELVSSPQDAFSLIHMFRSLPRHETWSGGRHRLIPDVPGGSMQIMDMRHGGRARITSSFDTMNVVISRGALDHLAEQIGVLAPADLRVPTAWLWRDRFMEGVQTSLAGAIALEEEVDDLVFDHLALTLLTHVAVAYGGMRKPSPTLRGSLSPAQLRTAQEAISETLESGLPLAEIALRCDLSPSHFSRAFKVATGKTPSAWRLERRIEVAQTLLRAKTHSIAEVALLCGFADQSHLTRTFSRVVGHTPAEWLRMRGARSA